MLENPLELAAELKERQKKLREAYERIEYANTGSGTPSSEAGDRPAEESDSHTGEVCRRIEEAD